MSGKLRMVGLLTGDILRQQDMQTKYGSFFAALATRFELLDIYDVSLKGFDRWMNALQVFSPDLSKWKEHFFKNVPAFETRSRKAQDYVEQFKGKVDFVLQVGVLFNANPNSQPVNTIIYTDYTAALSARRPENGRSPFNPTERTRWLELEQLTYQRSRHIFVRTRLVKGSLINDYDIPESKISVIGAGHNLSRLPILRSAPLNDPPTILFIGNDFYRKGGDILLRAFALVREKVPSARLLAMTAGSIPADLPQVGVELFSPNWDRTFIENLCQQAQVFVLPSRLETWGDVLLEAMAFELACIGVQGQAMDEIILEGHTGLLVKPEDPVELSQAILNLLNHPNWMADLGKAARQRLETEFTWEIVVDRIYNILSKLDKEMEPNYVQ